MSGGLLSIKRSELATKTLVYSSIVFFATSFKAELITPLKHMFLFDPLTDTNVVFLPLGIIVIISFFEGKQAPLFILPGALISQLTYFDVSVSGIEFFAILAVNVCAASLVFCVLDWTTLCNRREDMMHSSAWRLLLFGGFVSSVLISLMVHSIEQQHSMICAHTAQVVLLNAVGYLIGLFVVLGLLAVFFRCAPRFRRNATIVRCKQNKQEADSWNNNTR